MGFGEAKDVSTQKKDALIANGWVELLPEFDLEYAQSLDLGEVAKNTGYFLSVVAEKMQNNFLGLLSSDVDMARIDYLKTICPPTYLPAEPKRKAFIHSTWPFRKDDFTNSEAAFEELTYRLILFIIKGLGKPNKVVQSINNGNTIMELDPELFDIDRVLFIETAMILWDDVTVKAESSYCWNDNGAVHALELTLYSDNVRKLSNSVTYNIGMELNPKTYQLGELDAEFNLESFPEYIQNFSTSLELDMGDCPERFNVLIQGPPGYGKTRWAQAFAAEILAPRGYLVLVIDYSSLQDLVIPNYIDKICVIVNDADTLALDRAKSERGETEQVLAWLDGTRNTFIKPFYLEKRSSVITIMTANTIEDWDEAALRRGRIHYMGTFDKVNLSERAGNG